MDIVLLAKFVPDIARIPADAWDRERGTLMRSRLEMAFNPLDRVALGMALEVRAARPETKIVALSMGPPGAMAMLKEAVAYGADAAVLLTDKRLAGADTIATAYTISRAITQMVQTGIVDADCAVFCGMQSPDGDTAQVPAQVACLLDVPLYPYVCELAAAADALELKCLNSVGFQRVTTGERPFVVTATRLYPDLPFYVDLDAMQRANETDVTVWSRDDVDLDDGRIGLEGSHTRVIEIFEPERKHQTSETLSADDEEFAAQAAAVLKELKASFTSAGEEPAAAGEAGPAAATGQSYYAGDCAALCEMAGRRLAAVSHEIMGACAQMAAQLGSRPIAIVPSEADEAIAEELRASGARQAVFIEGLDRDVFRVHERADAVAAFVRERRPQMVVAPATLTGRVLAPYVSARLDCGLTADCSALEVRDFEQRGGPAHNVLFQTRPALGGNIMATIVSVYDDPASGRPQMATVRPGALPVRKLPAESCEIVRFRAPPPREFGDRVIIERQDAGEKQIDLEDFEVIVCVGMGVGDRETIGQVVEPFRAALEEFLGVPVGLGCSRAIVDAGVLPHSHQIGQTGIVVKPKIYFGLGVSGAIQHKIGMENSQTIVSVNRDPSASMHGFADHAIVGEIRQALPPLIDAMKDT